MGTAQENILTIIYHKLKILKLLKYTSLSTILGFLFNFIVGILTARLLGPEGVGIIKLAIFIPWLILVLTSGGLKLSNINFIASNKDDASSIFSYNIFYILFHSLFFIPLYIYVIIPILENVYIEKLSSDILYLGAIFITVNLIFYFFQGIVTGLKDIKAFSTSEILKTLFLLLWVIVVYYIHIANVILIYIGYIAGGLLASIYLLKKILSLKIRLNKDINFNHFFSLISFGIKGQFATIFNVLNFKFDIFLIGYFLPATNLGIYTIAVSLTNFLLFIPSSLINILIPKASSEKELKRYLPQLLKSIFYFTLIIGIILMASGKLLINILYSDAFIKGYDLLIILIFGTIFLGINQVITSALTGKGYPTIQSKTAGIGFVFTIILDIILIPKVGLIGAAIATSIAYTLMGFTAIYYLRKIEGISIASFLVINLEDIHQLNYWIRKSFDKFK